MRLDHDCVRDILLTIEEMCDLYNSTFPIEYLYDKLNAYEPEKLEYHIGQLYDGGLIKHIKSHDRGIFRVGDLSWSGHTYINNIRDNSIWHNLKESAGNLASVSIPVLVEKAAEYVTKVF